MLLFQWDTVSRNNINDGRLRPYGIEEMRNRLASEYSQVALTNGCFDLLHPGHIACLDAITDLIPATGLIVAINDDASVRALKGDGRPIINQYDRAYSLARLRMVDAVIVFDGNVEELVRAIRPDILAKGGDYTNDRIVGGDFVLSYGGRVHITPYWPAYSTSSILQRQQRDDKS